MDRPPREEETLVINLIWFPYPRGLARHRRESF
jgi:hypothetical protein